MKYWVAARETGDFIESFDTYEEAVSEISRYEAEDEACGDYTPDFYEVEDEDHNRLEAKKYTRDDLCVRVLMADGYTRQEAVKALTGSVHTEVWYDVEELAEAFDTTPEAIRNGEEEDLHVVTLDGHEYGVQVVR